MKKKKGPVKNLEHELENSDSYHRLPNVERSYNLPDGTPVTAREWKRQFDNEYYEGSRYTKRRIITDKDMIKEDYRRNNSSYKLDAQSVAERNENLIPLNNSEKEFMEAASEEWSWQDVYNKLGIKDATMVIFDQAIRDLDNKIIDRKITLTRFYTKLTKLKAIHRRRGTQK